jgi:NADH-quinone oxidoreductase subunit N
MNAIIISAIWGVVMMYSGIVLKNKSSVKYVAIAGVIALLIANGLEFMGSPFFQIETRGMLVFTTFGMLFNAVAFTATLIYFLLSASDIDQVGKNGSDYFALIFFVLCGVSIVSAFQSLLFLFIGVEIISIPLYILAGSDKRNLKSNEAALKYFLMGSFSTGLMLMGIALLYGSSGTFFVDGLNIGGVAITPLMGLGLILMMVSMAFKVSAAPFHFWTPDVYDGSPTVFTSFMATVVKAAVFVAFLRLFENGFGKLHASWQLSAAVITALTLIVGNFTAVFQQSVKRMLAYSSIAQAGFMMLAVFALNTTAKQGLLLYGAAYSVATIGLFAILMKMKDFTFDGFNGLVKHEPVLAITGAVFLLSLTGVPLTAGFFSKYYMLMAALRTGQMFWLVIIGVLGAAISAYYYFRVIQSMFFKSADENPAIAVSGGFRLMLVVTAALVILLGIKPGLLLGLLNY